MLFGGVESEFNNLRFREEAKLEIEFGHIFHHIDVIFSRVAGRHDGGSECGQS